MGKRGPKPDPEKQNQIQTKIYLKPENWKYVDDQKNKTEYINELIEKDRLENAKTRNNQTELEGPVLYPIRAEG
jgi:hypothetical protein